MFRVLNGQSGFLGGSLAVVPQTPPALGVTIKAGIGFQDAPTDVPTSIGGVIGLNDLSRFKPINLALDYNIAVPAPPGSNSRVDLIEVSYQRLLDNSQSREFLDVTSGNFNPANVAKTLDFNVDGSLGYYSATAIPTTALAYKSGVAASSPTPPSVDTGYMALAIITVANGATTITATNIIDERPIIPTGLFLGTQVLSGSGTYVPTSGATRARVRMIGAGGGGGGTPNTSTGTAGGGGASGVLLDFVVEGGISGGSYVCGTGGAGSAGGDGGLGGDTSLTISGSTYTARGGGGGNVGIDADTSTPAGHVSAGSTIPSDAAVTGNHGQLGLRGSNFAVGGSGGSTALGYGGFTPEAGGPGQPGTGFGAGGSGAARNSAGSALAGGAGLAGIIYVEEYA